MSDECLLRMARDWYGYGWWEAPYWFVGPEPGRPEKEDTVRNRCKAWMHLGAGELVDCKCHHVGFGWCRWHRDAPPPPTQPTWRQLIRLLLTLCNGSAPALEDIRNYQRCRWGMRTDRDKAETCVIDLCSLASPALNVTRNLLFDPNGFLSKRIEAIRHRIGQHQPKLLLMYGLSHASQFQELAECVLVPGEPKKIGSTLFVHTPAPTSRGLNNAYWVDLAARLRGMS